MAAEIGDVLMEATRLGFGEPVAISAETGPPLNPAGLSETGVGGISISMSMLR